MLDNRKVMSQSLYLSYPEYKTEGGKNYKIDYFQMTENGYVPVYIETDEVSTEQALSILLGGEAE